MQNLKMLKTLGGVVVHKGSSDFGFYRNVVEPLRKMITTGIFDVTDVKYNQRLNKDTFNYIEPKNWGGDADYYHLHIKHDLTCALRYSNFSGKSFDYIFTVYFKMPIQFFSENQVIINTIKLKFKEMQEEEQRKRMKQKFSDAGKRAALKNKHKMGDSKQSEAFFELFTQVRKEIADENGYHLATAIKKTFDKWNEWKQGMPEFDGKYLALIEHEQECKNVWKYQEVVDCIFNNWVLKDGQKVVGWKELSIEDGQ